MPDLRSGNAGASTGAGEDGEQTTATQPATRVERVYVEREHRVRTFLGDRDEDKVQSFEADVRRAWRRLPADDPESKKDVILDNIGPAVRLELGCLDPADQEDPEKLLQLIVTTYGESRSPHQLLRVLLDAHQQPAEDIRSFSHRLKSDFDRLVRRQKQLGVAEEKDSTLREQFVLGTRDVQLRRILRENVRGDADITFRTLRDTAVSYSDDTCGMATAAAAVSANSELLDALKLLTTQNQMMQQRLESFEEQLSRMSAERPPARGTEPQFHRRQDQPRRQFPPRGACYLCREPGHFKRDCPKARPQQKK